METKVTNTVQFTITPKKMKSVAIHLTKQIQNMSTENYKNADEAFKEDPNRCRDMPCLWTGRFNIVEIRNVSSIHLMYT